MPERPSAPGPLPPGAPRPPAGEPPPEAPRDADLADLDEDDGELADELFARAWPDDEEEEAARPEPPSDVEDDGLAEAYPTDDEDREMLEDPSADLDDLEDLVAADDTDIPVIEGELTVRLDGRSLPARVEWARSTTVWVRPAGALPDRDVTVEVAGRRLPARVQCLLGDQEVVLLGRDLLKGRFLLRA
jgi:hypothetical protein